MISEITSLYLRLETFLMVNSIAKPVLSNNAPIMAKFEIVQFTSSENCIATNGILSKTAVAKMMI